MVELSINLRILASLLAKPDSNAREAVQELATHYAWLEPAARELEELSLEAWQAEHARLFIGDHPGAPCPPFESAYMAGHRDGPRQRALKDLYRRMGMIVDGANPADYLGTLLECAAHLKDDPQLADQYWSELWDGHLSLWVPRFCRELRRSSGIVLYRVVAERLCELFPELRMAMPAVA